MDAPDTNELERQIAAKNSEATNPQIQFNERQPPTDFEFSDLPGDLGGVGAGGGGSNDGYQIYWADGTATFLDNDTVMGSFTEGTDTDWSIEFEVSASEFTKTVEYNTDTTLYNGDASAAEEQDFYRLPIVRGSNRLSFGGAYRENIFCAGNKGPIVELVKIA